MGAHFMTASILLAVISLVFGQGASWWENGNRLHKDLLTGYNTAVMPKPVHNHTTTIFLNKLVRGISIDENFHVLHMNSWQVMMWKDDRLKWDHKDYGGITKINLAKYSIWRPDITVYNSAEMIRTDHIGWGIPLTVYKNGAIVWVPPAKTSTECPLDFTYWPFDVQKCEVYLGSWTTNGYELDMVPLSSKNNSEALVEHLVRTNNHWRIQEVSLVKKTVSEKDSALMYVYLIYTITVARNSPAFASTVTSPAVVIALLTLVQFVLPVDFGPRIGVGLSAVGLSVFMLVVLSYKIPPAGTSCPLIIKYYAVTLYMAILSVVVSAVLARLSKEQLRVLAFPPPFWLKKTMTGPLATLLCVRSIADQVSLSNTGDKDSNEEEILATTSASYQHEWLLVAVVFDRIMQITYVVVYILSIFVFTSKLH